MARKPNKRQEQQLGDGEPGAVNQPISQLSADVTRALGEAIKRGSEGAAGRGQSVRETIRRLTGVDVRTDTEAMDYLAAEYGWEFARDYYRLPDAMIMDHLEAAARRVAARAAAAELAIPGI